MLALHMFSGYAAEQILSKMDGLVNLQNVLVVGMTNRKELLDEALLRPGRMEVRNSENRNADFERRAERTEGGGTVSSTL